MRIAVGSDDIGYPLKQVIAAYLVELGHEVIDHGESDARPVDYPDVAILVAEQVPAGLVDRAILVCGTGIGMAITANKVPGVRAASVSDAYSAERAIRSNNAQVLCLGSRVVSPENARILVDHWLAAEFQGGDSARKVAKIDAIDEVARSSRDRVSAAATPDG